MDNLSNMGSNTDSSTKSADNLVVSMGGEMLITPAPVAPARDMKGF